MIYGRPIGNIGSGLHKYLKFLEHQRSKEDEDFINLTSSSSIHDLLVGQRQFRKELIAYWKECAVTGLERMDLLVASHIKPWAMSKDEERLNPFNGLLLAPHLDKLFDRGYISFDADGVLLASSLLEQSEIRVFGLENGLRLKKLDSKHIPFHRFHRETIWVK